MDASSNRHIVVISGSAALADEVVASIPRTALLLAADGALDHALAAGIEPAVLVGDLDSVGASALAWAESHAEIRRHPADKDATDTELALAAAVEHSPDRITLVGGGDRLDHSLAAIGALGSPTLSGVGRLDGWWDGQHFEVVHGPGTSSLRVEAGSTLSLLALHGPCTGVSIEGTRWTLDHIGLEPVVGLGVSNIATRDAVTVSVESGVLTVFDAPTTPREAPTDPRTGGDRT
jgi:thiamine pyrophosphokinase